MAEKTPSFGRIIAATVAVWIHLALAAHAQIRIEFLQQPSNLVIYPCRTVTFNVVARALNNGIEWGPLIYQWQGQPSGASDWTDIAGATSSSFVPDAAWSSGPGKFRCVVSVLDKTAISAAAELAVVADCVPPTIVSAFALASENRTMVRYSVQMDPQTTTDLFNYRAGENWEHGPTNVFMADPFTAVVEWDRTEFSLQPDQVYRLAVDQVSAAAERECLCNFLFNSEVEFHTEAKPQIEVLQNPQDRVVFDKTSATFSADARGMSNGVAVPIKFQWQKNSGDPSNSSDWVDITGATNATYITVANRCLGHLLYRCRFQAGITHAFSLSARLTIVVDCDFLRVVSTVGDVRQNAISIQFSELLDRNTALNPANYQFISGPESELPVIDSISVSNFTVVLFLTPSTPLRAGGNYSLSISGVANLGDPACGCKFVLSETVASFTASWDCMQLTTQPRSIIVEAGAEATFEVGVRVLDGPGALVQYQWLKNQEPIPGATNRTYTAGPVAPADDLAEFSVLIKSSCRVVTSQAAILHISRNGWTAPVYWFSRPGLASDTIILEFLTNGRLQPDRVKALTNYSMTGGATVREAALNCAGYQVCLITSPQTPGTSYTVNVRNLADLQGNLIATNTRATIVAPSRVIPPKTVRLIVDADQMLLEWAPGGILMASSSPNGPYMDIPDQPSPVFVSPSPNGCHGEAAPPQRFYRMRWQ